MPGFEFKVFAGLVSKVIFDMQGRFVFGERLQSRSLVSSPDLIGEKKLITILENDFRFL